MRQVVFYAGVAVAGAAVMIYEFAAIRVLARDFGGAVDVWASEIAVCLGGLAIGYAVGGRLADAFPPRYVVAIAMAGAGITAIPIEWIALRAGAALLEVDVLLQWHPLIAAAFSSLLPLLFLGGVLPAAIKEATESVEHAGMSAGRIAAISTVGSIIGALAMGHYLLQHFGLRMVIYTTSAVLVIWACAIGLSARWMKPAAIILLALMAPAASGQVIYDAYSAYHHILVEDRNGSRLLRFDDDVQSTMSLADPAEGAFEYTDFFYLAPLMNPSWNRVLFLGLGGGSGPKRFLRDYPRVHIDVFEIDSTVIKVAEEYFGVKRSTRLTIREGDGRALLRRTPTRYDAIIMDAYGSGAEGAYLPYHMATTEFFDIVKQRLKNGGVLIYNAVGAYGGMNAEVINQLTVTMRDSFFTVYVFGAQSSINTLFMAQHIDPEDVDDDGTIDGRLWPRGPWLGHPLDAQGWQQIVAQARSRDVVLPPNMETRVTQFSRAHNARIRANILTDDYAPVDVTAPRRR